MRFSLVAAVVALLAGLAVLGSPSTASAHEHRQILGGKYEVVIGWINEPAVSDELNSLDFRISDLTQATPATDGGQATGAPVEGLESTLKVDVIYGDQTRTLTLEPRFRTPGAYNGWVIPVTPGDYAFHVYGTINGENVDETFTPGPETFSSGEDRAALEFPSASAGSPAAMAGVTGGSSGISRSDIGGGLAVGLAGLVALAAATAIRRRHPALRPVTHGASAGD
jgi:MYXO-CTERM domain-containing protein